MRAVKVYLPVLADTRLAKIIASAVAASSGSPPGAVYVVSLDSQREAIDHARTMLGRI
jgi:hypothetical protein